MRLEPLSEFPPFKVARPVMRQTWTELSFLHWPLEPAKVRPLVPAALDLDLYDGAAWVGLVPFLIEDLTLPKAPAVPWLSNFPETNVRTYVTDQNGGRGVWFFSLDAARLIAVLGARAMYGLPYYWARMNVVPSNDSIRYFSRRYSGSHAHTEIEIAKGPPVAKPSELEIFLTARFRLYALRGKRLVKAEIEHQPWQLHQSVVSTLNQSLVTTAGFPGLGIPPFAHFGGRVDVRVGRPQIL